MSGIVIGRKNLLKKVKPYLTGFFENSEYTFFNANTLYYTREERERVFGNSVSQGPSVEFFLSQETKRFENLLVG